MEILVIVITIVLIAFEFAAGIGKQVGGKSAENWRKRMKLSEPSMKAFGGLETGVAGIFTWSLFNSGGFNEKLMPYACLLLVLLKLIELYIQTKVKEPFAAKVGPLFVITLTAIFYFIR